jgi:hypothetical protein
MKKLNSYAYWMMLSLFVVAWSGCAKDEEEPLPVEEEAFDGGLATNGNFESGMDGWLFFENGGVAELDDTMSNGSDANSAKVATNGPSNPGIKQERIGIGTVQPGDVVQIQFDHIGNTEGTGGFFNVLLFVERAEGESGDPITHIFDPKPTLSDSWTTFTAEYTIPNGAVVSGGISFLIESVCGGDAGCGVSANVDNVVVRLNP